MGKRKTNKKMRVLYITPEPPSEVSGGGIGVKQSLISLLAFSKIDYIGPAFENSQLISSFSRYYFLSKSKNILKRILFFMFGITTQYFVSWLKIKDFIRWEKYDLVFLEFTKWDFVAKEASRKMKKFIVRAHNVEKDYILAQLRSKKNFRNIILSLVAIKKERAVLRLANKILAITERDKQRLNELYGSEINDKKVNVIPSCVNPPSCFGEDKSRTFINCIKFLFTGSLWFGPNHDGILWFLENVWKYISKDHILTIAGARPSKKIYKMSNKYSNIQLISNPKDMSTIFSCSHVFLAPIFDGSGMKVKIAQAFSYGLPVIGTTEASIGYEKALGKIFFIADNKESFIKTINQYLSMSNEDRARLSENSKRIFQYHFSIEASIQYFRRAFEDYL